MILSICLCVCPCGCLWLCRSRCLALRQLRKALTSASADAKFPFSLTVILTWSARRSEHQSRQLFLVHPPRRALFLSPIGLWTACSSEVTHVECPFPSPSTRRSPVHVVLGAPLRCVQHAAAHDTSSSEPPSITATTSPPTSPSPDVLGGPAGV